MVYTNIISQNEYSWESIDASSSIEKFEELACFYPESYQWDNDKRITLLKKLYSASENLAVDSFIHQYSKTLGVVYREMDSISLSLGYLNRSLATSYHAKSKSIALNNLGVLHFKSKDYQSALDYYFKAVEAAKELNNGSEAYPIGNISNLYAESDDHKNAIKYLKYSVGYSDKLPFPENIYSLVYDYSYLVDSYYQLNEVDSAEAYIRLALEKTSTLDTIPGEKFENALFIGFWTASDFYLNLGMYEMATNYIDETERVAQSYYMSSVDILRARNHLLKNNFQEAEAILLSDRVQKDDLSKEQILILLVQCYKGSGNLKKTIEMQDSLSTYLKQKFSADRIRANSFANAKYETLKKNEEIKSLKLDQQVKSLTIDNQRYLVLASSTLALLLFSMVSYLFWQHRTRKKMNEYLKQQVDFKTKDLKEANEELRTLSYIASHDIKEPIRNISNYVSMIQHKIDPKEKIKFSEYFKIINRSVKQQYTLVEDLTKYLSISKDSVVDMAPVDLNQLIDDIRSEIQSNENSKSYKISNKTLPTIQSNASILYIVLKNLIYNGIKYNESLPAKIKVNYHLEDGFHQIAIIDNGIGIDQKYHEKIFHSFKRLHDRSRYEGSGMGLSIVKTLVARMDGQVHVESEPDKGSTFTIRFPKQLANAVNVDAVSHRQMHLVTH